jgi:hypothetical protein
MVPHLLTCPPNRLCKAWYALSSGATSRGVFGGAPGFVVPIRKCPLDHFLEPASLHPVAACPRCPAAARPLPPAPAPNHQSAHPGLPQLPSPTLGPTPTRATPSASFHSSKTRAPPRSRLLPPARRSSPARALLLSSSASSPATPIPRCCHIGVHPASAL